MLGCCGSRRVFIGFASAADLVRLSFPDVLDETTRRGYQRRFSREHSLEFKRYILQSGATTIPLTFNLRGAEGRAWRLRSNETGSNFATLVLDAAEGPVLAQVDCQHRLGFLEDSSIEFAFMTYLALTVEEEMEVFRTINGKAKGLSGSLLDFTEARLVGQDLNRVKPELYLALRLHEDPSSPWHQRLDLGGGRTVGPKRVASLRTMQMAIKRLLRSLPSKHAADIDVIYQEVVNFWSAVRFVLPEQWDNPRRHMLAKGIGVYSLMSIAGELVKEAISTNRIADLDYFIAKLSTFLDQVDWSNAGPLRGFGGASGADAAFALLNQIRSGAQRRSIAYAQ
jgi:DGQHR domain-containing protein